MPKEMRKQKGRLGQDGGFEYYAKVICSKNEHSMTLSKEIG
jgi:hypothetical protein